MQWQQSAVVMGILNLTPDSFSDGGCYQSVDKALKRALQIQAEGAAIIDVGGESTRPNATYVSAQEELDRVIPVIERLKAEIDIPISIDSYKSVVIDAALKAGATFINDVKALQDQGALEIAAKYTAPICLMHMQGDPQSMQANPEYNDIITTVCEFFRQRIAACEAAGIARSRLILDPGFGFGKTPVHNLSLLKNLAVFAQFKLPLLIGVSNKSTIGYLLNRDIDDRLAGSLALAALAVDRGANIIRAHAVKATVDAVKITKHLSVAV